ncbi:MAG: Asp-tRNA(Asn)/Glu-tRNA(Gln) amidotransferase subunit GatA [Candidatus Omnitrophica bacterium]|nr:Asp-tRNA(Asn)/Glu-tRNA(Gln) amidotransferase subunit GatA [Candidatus Omnitrophota bacterium]MBU4479609.1 Asp-tRNA(Asn)/Glu-tRNA(Gln) amidotransferase subunit GatA [Candidatus Omnitrophota bacterium]MCG2703406.1 Asp-tRNA(Asn)/Glu-tRNA(Gln) amidotransferase subunit GatA [Candidatus Omnitrophota bacterium]
MELTNLSAVELLNLLSNGDISPREVAAAYIKRIESLDKKIKAFVHFEPEKILKKAENIRSGKLNGLPIAIKDNLCVKGEPATCGSRILSGFRPPYNATVIEKLEREGALFMGKVNMDEFAFGSSCETSCYGPTYNPWDTSRAPGGSSGGSAAAVAARLVPWALGSDTGGSIRQPASFCGTVGLKPTYGRVSRYGLIAFASSLDQIGPLTQDVKDAAMLMNIISGHDPKDSTSVDTDVPDYLAALNGSIKGLKIAIPKEYFSSGIDAEVKEAIIQAIEELKRQGAAVEEISLPHTEYAVATYYIVAPSEASSNLARFDGVQYGLRLCGTEKANENALIDMYTKTRGKGFGPEAKRRIILGTYTLSSGYYDAYYLKALKVRTKIAEDFKNAFSRFDCIVTPTSPTSAFKIGERTNDPLAMYLSDIFTIPANLAGIPALSIPCGFTKENLPVGLQLLGKPFDEALLLKVGHAYQQQTNWHKQMPEMANSS